MIPGGIGMMEGVLILFVVLVLFGAKKLPIRSFKKSIAGIEDKTDQVIEEKSST
jgi:Sec-independent protein translocase protein TatA